MQFTGIKLVIPFLIDAWKVNTVFMMIVKSKRAWQKLFSFSKKRKVKRLVIAITNFDKHTGVHKVESCFML